MNLATMLQDVLTSLVRRPVTEKYPAERRPVPVRLRGMVMWDREECIGCGLCTKDCPAEALELSVFDRKEKRLVMRYHVDRCLFCAQCASTCPTRALSMSPDRWELAALCRKPFEIYSGRDADVEAARAGQGGANDDAD